VRWTLVSWDTWQTRERPHGDLGVTLLDYMMSPAEAIEAFTRVISSPMLPDSLVNSTGDLEARLRQWVHGLSAPASPAGNGKLHPRPELSTPFEAPEGETERAIAEIWQQVLGVSVGRNDLFLDLGGNSLIATQLIAKVRRRFQITVPLIVLFD